MAIDNKYKSEHLMLLVGSNPLPNAVAGRLLCKPEGKITLVHSKESKTVANSLNNWLTSYNLKINKLVEIEDEADPIYIFGSVQRLFNEYSSNSIGLHYTGGTKSMAVHAWQAAEQWSQEQQRPRPIRSYLNPRSLEIVIDPDSPRSGQKAIRLQVGQELELTIEDLLQLHGRKLTKDNPLTYEAILPKTANALANCCAEKESYNKWKSWVDKELEGQCRAEKRRDKWKSKTDLKEIKLGHFEDEQLKDTITHELNLVEEKIPLKHDTFGNDPEKFCKWLHGLWLENHVLAEMHLISKDVKVHQVAGSIKTQKLNGGNEKDFEVDIVAIRGYQMFAISCTTSSDERLLKSKLFEVYVRARQMGGDEARIALVCCSDKPEQVQSEMEKDLQYEDRIVVFGRQDLPDIGDKLKYWILEQSNGGR
jgi:hypothetical protein